MTAAPPSAVADQRCVFLTTLSVDSGLTQFWLIDQRVCRHAL